MNIEAKHPILEDTANLTQGRGAEQEIRQIRHKLNRGITSHSCQRVLDLAAWALASAAHFIKSHFAPQPAQTIAPEVALLAFDSLHRPAPAGVRTVGACARQLLYKAGPFLIDLRVDPAPLGGVCVVGQVFDSARSQQGITDAPVHLLSGENKKASTTTNQFGEFHLEIEDCKSLQLQVGINSKKQILVPLHAGGRSSLYIPGFGF
jgi:hypothetical protein